MASEVLMSALIQADEWVPLDLVSGLESVINMLRECSGNPWLYLIVQRGQRPEYYITLSDSQAETTFTVAASNNALDEVRKKLLGPIEATEVPIRENHERTA